jgi:hypothetical protein
MPATTISLDAGWNIIGSREVPVLKSALVTNPAGLIYGTLFLFDNATGSYVSSTVIPPGAGAWIYVTQSCTLTIP